MSKEDNLLKNKEDISKGYWPSKRKEASKKGLKNSFWTASFLILQQQSAVQSNVPLLVESSE